MSAAGTEAPSDHHLQPVVAAELATLAAALDPLPAEAWDTPSLCTRWRVREVVAHLTMAARYGTEEFLAELAADGFDFGALSDRVAARDGALGPSSLVADLRSETMATWAPPGGGFAGALTHVVVHGLDVTVPLGLGRVSSDDAIRHVLGGLTSGGGHAHFGTDPTKVELRATDLDWRFGTGAIVEVPAHVIVLVLCGRSLDDEPDALCAVRAAGGDDGRHEPLMAPIGAAPRRKSDQGGVRPSRPNPRRAGWGSGG